jgi:hypothetical protein
VAAPATQPARAKRRWRAVVTVAGVVVALAIVVVSGGSQRGQTEVAAVGGTTVRLWHLATKPTAVQASR